MSDKVSSSFYHAVVISVILFSLLSLSACTSSNNSDGVDGGGGGTKALTYTVGGTVSGLVGSGLVLQNNKGDDFSVSADGDFTFATPVASGSTYDVTVFSQPLSPAQTCTVSNASNKVDAANITSVKVNCSTAKIGGTVQGMQLNLTPTVSTFVGLPATNWVADGTGGAAGMDYPYHITSDGANLYVTDCGTVHNINGSNNTIVYSSRYNEIRKIVIATGEVTTLAGSGAVATDGSIAVGYGAADGTGTAAEFNCPTGIATDGSSLYVADTNNNKIRKITPQSGSLADMTSANAVVTSLTGTVDTAMAAGADDSTTGATATFNKLYGIVIEGDYLYVADSGNNKIRKVAIANGATSSLTGVANMQSMSGAADGSASSVTFASPVDVTSDGTYLYVADYSNNKIRQVSIADGSASSLTGTADTSSAAGASDGSAASVTFNYPWGLTTDGSYVYVSDYNNYKIRKVSIVDGTTSSLTGTANTQGSAGSTDGALADAMFKYPIGINFDNGKLYISDTGNHTVRRITISSGLVSTLAGAAVAADGTGAAARITAPYMGATDGINLYVSDCGGHTSPNTIRKVVIATGETTTLAGTTFGGSDDGIGTAATFYCPAGITTDGTSLFVVDDWNYTIRKITPSSGTLADMSSDNAVVTTVAGQALTAGAQDGSGDTATFYYPWGITTDGNSLFVTDYSNNKIRKITPSSGTLSAMTATTAVVSSLTGVADTQTAAGADDGTGDSATFNGPNGITTDGVNLYVTDWSNNKIRVISHQSGVTLSTMTSATAMVSSLTGASGAASAATAEDGTASAATFNTPGDITTDGFNLYIVDTGNNKIRMISPTSGAILSTMTSATATVSSITGVSSTAVPTKYGVEGYVDGPGLTATFNQPQGITTDGISLYVSDSTNGTIRKIQ